MFSEQGTMIFEIRGKIKTGRYEFSEHALNQAIKRSISVKEVRETILNGEIIEDYPDDKYGASCLIFGVTSQNRSLHIVCSYPSRDLIKIITVYEPNPQEWIQHRTRR